MKYVNKLAVWLYEVFPIWKNTTVFEDIKTLYPKDSVKRQRKYVIEKISVGILVLLVGGTLGIMFLIKEVGVENVKNNQLQRSSYGEGSQSISLRANNGIEEANIILDISERLYQENELQEMYEEFLAELTKVVLGENKSFDEICYDLNLVSSLKGYPFEIQWHIDEEYLDRNGQLIHNELSEISVIEVTAKITCQEFKKEETFWCCIRSRASPLSMQDQLQRQLQKIEEDNREREFVMLPTKYGGNEIVWTQQTQKTSFMFLLATPFVCILLMFCKDKDLHKRVEEREEQMKIDYPELVSKLALLLGAGMTVSNAWERIVADYGKKNLPEAKKRYAYEEMLFTANEWKNGVFQQDALEGFGRRCRIPCYSKLTTLLTQNVKTGSVNLALLLQEEAIVAFEERKHLARRQGEKAGTKLLVPMMLLLCIVMVIIIVPTFLSNV